MNQKCGNFPDIKICTIILSFCFEWPEFNRHMFWRGKKMTEIQLKCTLPSEHKFGSTFEKRRRKRRRREMESLNGSSAVSWYVIYTLQMWQFTIYPYYKLIFLFCRIWTISSDWERSNRLTIMYSADDWCYIRFQFSQKRWWNRRSIKCYSKLIFALNLIAHQLLTRFWIKIRQPLKYCISHTHKYENIYANILMTF